jgi:uncharacterized linocin/CFP29 family protein
MAELNWSDGQWQKVKDAVTEAFAKSSVSSAFLPLYGPLSGSAEIVRNERLTYQAPTPTTPLTLKLDGDHDAVNLKLVNITVNVVLSSEQVAEEALSNALLAFRRAANVLAQEQDRIVFDGFGRGFAGDDSRMVVNKIPPQQGLADLAARQQFNPVDENAARGPAIVSAVVRAIHELEDDSHPAPFAVVLGNALFEDVYEPAVSLALPAERITPLLKGGPLLRSGNIQEGTGIVVSLAGNAVDIVVGTPPTVQFLQRQIDAKFAFRVYERFVLRIRDIEKPPVTGFRIRPDAGRIALEQQRLARLKELAELIK